MGKIEDIEGEKKKWESDEAWELRKAFMMAHYDDYPKIQLQCLSQLFINVTVLGCEYSETLMEKIKQLGSGIRVKTDRTATGSYVKASVAKKRQAVKTSDLEGDGGKKSRQELEVVEIDLFNEKLAGLKKALGMTPHHMTAEQMLKSAASSCLIKWHLQKSNTKIDIYIDRYLALRHTFSQYCVEAQQASVNAIVESFLSCNPTLKDSEVSFDEQPTNKCYANSVARSFAKVKGNIMEQQNYKGLSQCLDAVNISLVQNTKKLEGWSQQLDIVAADVLLASRTLSSKECTRPAMAAIADEMAANICQMISSDRKIEEDNKLHNSLAFVGL